MLAQASAKTLTEVVEEVCLWQPGKGGMPYQLHLLHVALLPPDGKTSEFETVKQQVRRGKVYLSEEFAASTERYTGSACLVSAGQPGRNILGRSRLSYWQGVVQGPSCHAMTSSLEICVALSRSNS